VPLTPYSLQIISGFLYFAKLWNSFNIINAQNIIGNNGGKEAGCTYAYQAIKDSKIFLIVGLKDLAKSMLST
jgi:hypothetical protein